MEEITLNDSLDNLIASRLGARQDKVKKMESMANSKPSSVKLHAFIGVAAAACAVVLFAIAPLFRSSVSPVDELGIGYSSETFRSASPEISQIENLIKLEKYEEAALQTKEILSMSENELSKMEKSDDEETQYELQGQKVLVSDLRWTYIWLLVKTGDYEQAKQELDIYLKTPEFNEHQKDAKSLKEKIE